MATTDFSRVPDAQLEYIFGLLENNPEFIPDVAERQAFVSEYFGRRGRMHPGASQSAAPKGSANASFGVQPPMMENIYNNLMAAATPIEPDPEVQPPTGPRPMKKILEDMRGREIPGGRMTDDRSGRMHMLPEEIAAAFAESDAYLQSPEAVARRAAERAQMVSEITGTPLAGSATSGGSPFGRTQIVDGVEVPVIDGGGGRQMYRLGDVKAAQAAQREAARLAGVREVNRLDREQFGYGADDAVTPEQLAARRARQAAFAERASSPEVVTRRVQALAQRMGVSEKQAMDAYNNAAGNMDAARRELSGMDGVVDSRLQQKADARKMITRRAQAQNNPMEYLGRDDLNDWQRMVMARRLVGSSGFTPIEMQARRNEGLQRLGERFMQNPAMLMGGQQMEAMDRRTKAERVAGWRRIAAAHASGLYNSLGWRGRDTAMRALQTEGASPDEALEIVEEFFAPEDAPPEAEPARGAGGLPLPAGTPPYQWR